MPIEINGKIYRNIQEQVKENQDNIAELETKVDALEQAVEPESVPIQILVDNTYNDVVAYLEEGHNILYTVHNDRLYIYSNSTATYHEFVCMYSDNPRIYYRRLSNADVWSGSFKNIQTQSNMTQTISESTTLYPSAKAVHDYVGNIKAIYFATHGTTTYAEITTALNNNELPVCIYNDRCYIYGSKSSTVYRFYSMQSDYVRYITVDNTNTWSAVSAYNLELVANKTTTITNASTDAQYPSAKAVYTSISNAISNVYKFLGSKTPTEINALTTADIVGGTVYNITQDGTLTLGSVSVKVGDNVAFDKTNTVWDKLAASVDLSNYVSLDGTQTITGTKTFDNQINFVNSNHYIRKGSGNVVEIGANGNTVLTLGSSSSALNTVLRANTDNQRDLGQIGVRWKDLYIAGNLSDASNSIPVAKIENTDNKTISLSNVSTDTQYPSAKCVYDNLVLKQDTLTSGTNIKTLNGQSLLGSGDMTVQATPLPERLTIAYNLVVNINGVQWTYNGGNPYWTNATTSLHPPYTTRQLYAASHVLLTNTDAIKAYTLFMTGNQAYDVYNANAPTPMFIICSADNTMWKLQYEGNTNGLVAYKVENSPIVLRNAENGFTTRAYDSALEEEFITSYNAGYIGVQNLTNNTFAALYLPDDMNSEDMLVSASHVANSWSHNITLTIDYEGTYTCYFCCAMITPSRTPLTRTTLPTAMALYQLTSKGVLTWYSGGGIIDMTTATIENGRLYYRLRDGTLSSIQLTDDESSININTFIDDVIQVGGTN